MSGSLLRRASRERRRPAASFPESEATIGNEFTTKLRRSGVNSAFGNMDAVRRAGGTPAVPGFQSAPHTEAGDIGCAHQLNDM
jgi:hypothetical protein